MTLQPCPQCSRHIRANETVCPFCAATISPAAPAPTIYGRWSRAAVFAGLAGCYTSNPPPQNPPPPDQQQFAQPPATAGAISGVVTDGSTPLANVPIFVDGQGVQISRTTDANGRYEIGPLRPGGYRVTFGYSNHPRRPAPFRQVEVRDASVRIDMVIAPQAPYDPSMDAKPYGAPPARRRVV